MSIVDGVEVVPLTDIEDIPSEGGLGNVMSLSCIFFFGKLMI